MPETPLAAARRIAPLAAELADEVERRRGLPSELFDEIRDAGLFRLCVPGSLGGREATAAELLATVEELARADGSTAWCVMIAATSGILAAYVPHEQAREIYGDRDAVTAGVIAPRGRARPRGDDYVVSGRWPFASGVNHCTWVLGGCTIYDGDRPRLLEDGSPDVRLALMPASAIEVIDTWDVAGLCGSGSHDMVASEQPVPGARTLSLASDLPREPGPLYSFPLFGLLALGIAAVALGIARASIEDLVRLAGAKTPDSSSRPLAQRATVQAELARAEASLRAAHALVMESVGAAWQAARARTALSTEHRLSLRLAATHATRASAAVVDAMYGAGGGTSIYRSSPLQRRFRDVHVATAHMMVSPASDELTGRLLLGLPTDTRRL